jgi:hypothetical protein
VCVQAAAGLDAAGQNTPITFLNLLIQNKRGLQEPCLQICRHSPMRKTAAAESPLIQATAAAAAAAQGV